MPHNVAQNVYFQKLNKSDIKVGLAIGQCRLRVHGICGLNNPWHHLLCWKLSRPPFVASCGSAR